jgi:DNA-binding response OmpR family regulator
MPAQSILLADEDASLLEVERFYLEREGFRIFSVRSGFDVLNSVQNIHPDLILLAMKLPGLGGFEICSRLRSENNQVPVMAIFASEIEMIQSINIPLDADDYLAKPFPPREMVARVKAILHPQKPRSSHKEVSNAIGALKFDSRTGDFKIKDRVVQMRSLDHDLLLCLMNEAGKFVSPDHLMRATWGADDVRQTASVDAHVARLQNLLSGCRLKIVIDSQAGYKLES